LTTFSLVHVASYIGAGLAVGISSIGAGVGEGFIAANTSQALMQQPKASESLLKTMLIGQALTETGAIFSLVIAMLLLFGGITNSDGGWQMVVSLFGAGLVVGLGSLGPALGNGYTGGQTCKGIGRQPREANLLTANMLIGQGIISNIRHFCAGNCYDIIIFYASREQHSKILCIGGCRVL